MMALALRQEVSDVYARQVYRSHVFHSSSIMNADVCRGRALHMSVLKQPICLPKSPTLHNQG